MRIPLALSAGLALALACATGCARPAARARPNILLVSIDSLRADHVHAYGYARETSPRIDRLAAEGVLFQTALSPASWTLPAHVTLLTALPPRAHGVKSARLRLTEAAVTLAEVLKGAGYATAGFVSGPLLRSIYGHGQGFDVYDDRSLVKRRALSHRGVSSPDLVRLAADWLDAWSRDAADAPFFLFVHFWDVHYDYDPPPPYDRMFDPDYQGTLSPENFETNPEIRPGMDPRDLEHLVALYDGEIRFTDHHLGGLIDRLDALGVARDTIVVITADHGDEFFEHGSKGHAHSLYDEIVRVPLVIRYPARIPPATVVGDQVRLMDVAPTLLGLAGVDDGDGFGRLAPGGARVARDLAPWLTGEAGDEPFPELLAYGQSASWPPRVTSIRTRDRKLVAPRDGSSGIQYYDLEADPLERRRLERSSRYRAEIARLRADLRRWNRRWDARGAPLAQPLRLDGRMEADLRALGYLE